MGNACVAESYRYRTALAPLGLAALARNSAANDNARVNLTEGVRDTQINVRGKLSDAAFVKAVRAVAGCEPPAQANTVARGRVRGSPTALLWLGPDEWLLQAPSDYQAKAVQALTKSLAPLRAAMTDVSDARAVLKIQGEAAVDVLMKGCSLDLHRQVFSVGACAQTTLGLCQVIIHHVEDSPAYDIYVGRSFADYAWRWLCDASKEYSAKRAAPA